MAIHDRVERGETPRRARRRALLEFGSPARIKEDTRSVWTWTALEQLVMDLQIGARVLWRASGLSATAVMLIALVVGGNTTIFSMVHGMLTKPARGIVADRLVTVGWVDDRQPAIHDPQWPSRHDYRRRAAAFQWSPAGRDLRRLGDAARLRAPGRTGRARAGSIGGARLDDRSVGARRVALYGASRGNHDRETAGARTSRDEPEPHDPAGPVLGTVSYAHRSVQSFWSAERIATDDHVRSVTVERNEVGPGYLRTFGVAPLLGRDFGEDDADQGTIPAVINQRLAETLWPDQLPLGGPCTSGHTRSPS
jgi:hypothetical protein